MRTCVYFSIFELAAGVNPVHYEAMVPRDDLKIKNPLLPHHAPYFFNEAPKPLYPVDPFTSSYRAPNSSSPISPKPLSLVEQI